MKQETINKIKQLKEEGKKAVEISKELGISYNSVLYYYNDEIRKKTIERAKESSKKNWKKRDKERVRKYMKNYMKDYYHNTENHERLKEYHREYQRKRYQALSQGIND